MKYDGKSYWDFMVPVAMHCCQTQPLSELQPDEVAKYIQDVLTIASGEKGITVEAIQYPPSAKIPLLIKLEDRVRLLWLYPAYANEEWQRSDIAEVLVDLLREPALVSA